jgi:hypothetical protein
MFSLPLSIYPALLSRIKITVGMGIAELRWLRVLEEENSKLKQLVADLSMDKQMLQDILRKKV